MSDPFAYMWQVFALQQQMYAQQASIFDSITFWVILFAIAPVVIRFAFLAFTIWGVQRQFGGTDAYYKPGPMGPLGPFFGVPAVIPKTQGEIADDRHHAYRWWGTVLSAMCIVGGIILFMIGVTGNTDVELTGIMILRNAAPGTVLFVIGFLIWRSVYR